MGEAHSGRELRWHWVRRRRNNLGWRVFRRKRRTRIRARRAFAASRLAGRRCRSAISRAGGGGFLSSSARPTGLHRGTFLLSGAIRRSRTLLRQECRSFSSTSMGRLFDAGAALLGFTSGVSYEGQAAIWLEQAGAARGKRRRVRISIRWKGTRFSPFAASRRPGSRARAKCCRRSDAHFNAGLLVESQTRSILFAQEVRSIRLCCPAESFKTNFCSKT